jgi:flagellar basal-body rod protein FlgF
MIRGLYSAASGMFSLERKQEALANNLANAQTAGFKKDDTVLRAFPKLLINRINDLNGSIPVSGAPKIPAQPAPIGELANGVYAQERIPSFNQGPLVQTNNALDIAINDQDLGTQDVNGRQVKPNAFFAVGLPNGTIGYTRNGKWDLDSNGHLVTSEGYRVLGANGQPIQLDGSIRKEDLQIDQAGNITTSTGNMGQIGIVLVNNPFELRRLGGNIYQTDTPIPFVQDAGVSLNQGFIEQSNVDPGQTMSEMMMTVRGYEANQKVITVYNTSLEQLYSVGRLNG